jgi:AraC-like DNA-binding protein
MAENRSPVVSFAAPPLPYYIECGKTLYAPGEQHPNRHNLGMFDLLVIESGTLHIGEEERGWELTAGHMLLLLPDRYHYAVKPCGEETRFFWIHFNAYGKWHEAEMSGPWMKELDSLDNERLSKEQPFQRPAPYTISMPKHAGLSAPKMTFAQLERLLELHTELRSESFWEQQQLFLQLLRQFDEGQKSVYASPALAVAEQTEAFIKQHYQTDITNAMLGEALHFHPGYIVRCMKESYRCTPMEYLLYYRVERAKLLLLKTEWPVSAVAEQVGFSQTPYFSVCFKKQTGLSPLQFRKRFAK